MSSAVISASAALGRPFVFDGEEVGSLASGSRAALDRTAEGGCPHINLAGKSPAAKIWPASVTAASRLEIRPAPEMVSSGIPAIDALTGGLPRGCLTEVCGPASSGRTTLLMATLAAATRRGEFCVVVDACGALDPQSAAAAGVELERLLWVRCGDDIRPKRSSPQSHRGTEKNGTQKEGYPISRAPSAREACSEVVERGGISSGRRDVIPSQPAFDFEQSKGTGSKKNLWNENSSRQSEHRLEQVLRATDLLLESGGFGLIVLDLGDLPPQAARRIPLTTWFRFRRAIEHTPTILLAIEQQAIAGSCSSLLLQLGGATDEAAAERQKITARSLPRASQGGESHGLVARGSVDKDEQAPKERKKINPALPENPTHVQLFTGLNITAELVRSRLDRKPARSIAFATKTAWAG